MTTPREVLADTLTTALPAARVLAYARNIDAPNRDTAMVRVDEILPHPESPTAHRLYRFTVIILTGKVAPDGPGDDALDLLLEDTLHAIDTDDTFSWTRATRAVWLDTTTPAYEVAVEVTHKKESTP